VDERLVGFGRSGLAYSDSDDETNRRSPIPWARNKRVNRRGIVSIPVVMGWGL